VLLVLPAARSPRINDYGATPIINGRDTYLILLAPVVDFLKTLCDRPTFKQETLILIASCIFLSVHKDSKQRIITRLLPNWSPSPPPTRRITALFTLLLLTQATPTHILSDPFRPPFSPCRPITPAQRQTRGFFPPSSTNIRKADLSFKRLYFSTAGQPPENTRHYSQSVPVPPNLFFRPPVTTLALQTHIRF